MPISEGTLLPPIPTKLSQIDETTVSQHFLLAPTDVCYHIWEYTRRGGFTASPTNNLISNLKKKPSKIQTNPREAPWKEQAIGYCAQALQRMMNRPWVEGFGTLVPIPCSKIAGHPDQDSQAPRSSEFFLRAVCRIHPWSLTPCPTWTCKHDSWTREPVAIAPLHRFVQA